MTARTFLKSCLQSRYLTLPWGRHPILLEYALDPHSRYGHGKSVHAGLDGLISSGIDRYSDLLQSSLQFRDNLLQIPAHSPSDSVVPSWTSGFFSGLDAIALYSLLRMHRPSQFIEIGSGDSTLWAARATRDGKLTTRITSIDPYPRKHVDGVCDRVIRSRLEDCDLAVFSEVKPGDFVFIDSSHRCFMNSDVTAFFLDVLPRLPAGTFVQFHDVFLPEDYPQEFAMRYYSEQYLLAVYLLANPGRTEILMPSRFVSRRPEAAQILSSIWDDSRLRGVKRGGSSFWLRLK